MRCQVSDVRCQVPDVRCQVSGVRFTFHMSLTPTATATARGGRGEVGVGLRPILDNVVSNFLTMHSRMVCKD